VQASMQAAEMTTTLLVMTLSVARSYRLYANNHPCRVNGVGVAARIERTPMTGAMS
jgi:hypothetical protein